MNRLAERKRFLTRLGKNALNGDACAQFYLSVLYEGARGFTRDLEKAAKWCVRAARAGDVQSQYRLSKMLASGSGFTQKHERAAWYWLESAAKAGHVQAQYELGLRYFLGVHGVRKSIASAKIYFDAAAKRDHPDANYYMGYLFSHGIGFIQDHKQAAQYLKIASHLGNLRAKCDLAFMYSHGHGVEKDIGRSVELYEQAAAGGHLGAQFGLACLYLTIEQYKSAQVWLSLAANNDIAPAQAVYAKFLTDGPKPYRDKVQALMWCLIVKAAQEADQDSRTVTDGLATRLAAELAPINQNKAVRSAQEWLAHRAETALYAETDWTQNIKLEMQFYENKKNRRSAR